MHVLFHFLRAGLIFFIVLLAACDASPDDTTTGDTIPDETTASDPTPSGTTGETPPSNNTDNSDTPPSDTTADGTTPTDTANDNNNSNDTTSGNTDPVLETYTVSGIISNLSGSGLVLQNAGTDDLAISGTGQVVFSFATALASGENYDVSILTQPSDKQFCSVSNGSGTVSNTNIDNIVIDCVNLYSVGGVVNNLSGSGLVLQNSADENLNISGNGQVSFSFSTKIREGEAYNVTVLNQPSNTNQICSVSNGSGVATADVNDIVIDCISMMTISGTVNGLTGTGLVLQNSGADDLSISTNGSFTFPGSTLAGADYNVTVSSQPTSPGQICSVANGVGIVNDNISNIEVNCVTNAANTYSISGKVNNLQGQGLVISNQSTGDSITISGKGVSNFTFPTTMTDAQSYSLAITTMPTSANQDCVISSGSTGTIAGADVNDIVIDCTTRQYQISGSISGLNGSGMQLQINNDEIIDIANNSQVFSFTPIDDGSLYDIKVLTPPKNLSQECTVTNASGQLSGTDITNVSIDCVTSSFKVSGIFYGLRGRGLQIEEFLTKTPIPLATDGSATFELSTSIIDGGSYWIRIKTPPQFPYQQCTSIDQSGYINGADVTIIFECVDLPTLPVSGRVSGLTGSGLVLQINGGNDLTLNGNGSGFQDFTFSGGLPENVPYEVTITNQPDNPAETCTVQPIPYVPYLTDPLTQPSSTGISNIFINCDMDYNWLNPTLFGEGIRDIIWGDGKLLAAAYDNQLFTSTDTNNWNSIKITDNGFSKIIWTGDQYVAIGSDGLFTSTDNVNWTLQNTGTTEQLNSVIWTGSRLVAAGRKGTLITSPDGINWTTRNPGTTMDLYDLAWDGETLVAVGLNVITSSFDSGAGWLAVVTGTGYTLSNVVWTGSQFVAVGLTGSIWPYSGLAATSTDGVKWTFTAENSLPVNGILDLVWNGSKLVAVTVDGDTATSTNGTTWSNHTQTGGFKTITWTGTQFVIAGGAGTFATSTDGANWTYKDTTVTDLTIKDFIYTDNLLVALGGSYGKNYQILPLVMTSTDNGQSWTVQTTPATQWIEKAAWSGSLLVAVGKQGQIMTSSDMINWTIQTSGTTADLLDVIWSNNLFIASGTNGTLLTSADGINWSLQATGLTNTIEGTAYNGTTMVAVTSNSCYLSTDTGTTWMSSVSTCEGTALFLKDSNFISFKSNGDILESSDGSNWNIIGNDGSFSITTKDMAWNGSKLARVGDNGKVLISDNFIHWQQLDNTYGNAVEWVGDKLLLGGGEGRIVLSE